MADGGYKRTVLVEDERGRGFPAVLRYGPYLFVSGSDGHRDPRTEKIDPELYDKAVEQCRNSYGRLQQRLVKAGFSGDCAVWIQNFTSGQQWRLQRMAQWPEFFGEEGHGQAVSFGAQSRMSGINMLTSSVLALVPELPRKVAVKQPTRGRASRITRVGPLVFIIGVRGHADPATEAEAPEETEGAFDIQLDYCMKAIRAHMDKDGTPHENLLRVDTALRGARFVPAYHAGLKRNFAGKVSFATYAIGTPLGGRCEQEIGAVAAAPGEARQVFWSERDSAVADATRAGNLVFLRGISGLRDEGTGAIRGELHGDGLGQVKQAVRNLDRLLIKAGAGLESLLRFDVFVRDIYAEDEIIAGLRNALGKAMPAITVIGGEPADGAELEIAAIAGA